MYILGSAKKMGAKKGAVLSLQYYCIAIKGAVLTVVLVPGGTVSPPTQKKSSQALVIKRV